MIYPPVLPVFFAQFGKNDLLCRCTADASYTQKTASHLLVQTRRGLLRYWVWGIGGIMSLRGGLRLSPSRCFYDTRKIIRNYAYFMNTL